MAKDKNKIKVRHGVFIEDPKCMYCGKSITHEWLGGDYTLLICDDKECLKKCFEELGN